MNKELQGKGPVAENGWRRVCLWRYDPGSGYSGDDRVGPSFYNSYEMEGRSDLRIDEEFYIHVEAYDDGSFRYSVESVYTTMHIDANGDARDEEIEYDSVGLYDYDNYREALKQLYRECRADNAAQHTWNGE